MNANPIQHGPDDREELARLLPGPAERDLPSGRHRQLQEFVMSQIEQDQQAPQGKPRRSPRRRPVLLAVALTAVAATTAAVVVATGATGGSSEPPRQSPPSAAASPSGQQILLVAATSAEQAPERTGRYWYVKVVLGSGQNQWETWRGTDGREWFRGKKTRGEVEERFQRIPFRLAGAEVSFKQLRTLPTEPKALRAWLTKSVEGSDVRTSAGRPDAAMRQQIVFDGLVSLVSQLPAPPKVRAAAFRAIAASPNVKSLGPVEGGQGLLITMGHGQARLVVDPATSRVRNTNHFVTDDGAQVYSPDGATIVAEWTNTLPK